MNNVVIGQQLHEKHSQMNLSYETKPQKKMEHDGSHKGETSNFNRGRGVREGKMPM
jgi:hypothetical protein